MERDLLIDQTVQVGFRKGEKLRRLMKISGCGEEIMVRMHAHDYSGYINTPPSRISSFFLFLSLSSLTPSL
ncbi:hypothetical protein A2U01_0004619 [Trifolium medium]|uniref:Uncharacterized protein n=1 Tax=Trifolium medium TaxID=97028 RepID=A0A392M9I6_9FABA|nr:hypothetical protein [Trifolium medium]